MRNNFFFVKSEYQLEKVAETVMQFICVFQKVRDKVEVQKERLDDKWKLLSAGIWKVNFNTGRIGNWGRGWSWVI